MKSFKLLLSIAAMLLMLSQTALADPINRISGLIVEVGEGFLWVVPDGQNDPQKFILKWKVRFSPPRLPIKGDQVVLLYKNKDEGRLIYGVDYLKQSTDVFSTE